MTAFIGPGGAASAEPKTMPPISVAAETSPVNLISLVKGVTGPIREFVRRAAGRRTSADPTSPVSHRGHDSSRSGA